MMSETETVYRPDMAIPPGETIREAMEARGMNQAELAKRLEKTRAQVTEILKGRQEVSPDVALRLESVLGIPASFWLNLQAQYKEVLARIQRKKTLEGEAGEVSRFPYVEMASLGWVPKTRILIEKAENLLSFFALSSLRQVEEMHKAAYAIAYRKSQKREANPDHLAAWLRRGEIEAQEIATGPFNRASLKERIADLKALTLQPADKAGNTLKEICAASGVAVAYVPHLAQTHVNGATMWIRSEGSSVKDKPVILLTLRYRWADIFWFTFFHEIYHVLSEKKNQVFIQINGVQTGDEEERQADKFASDSLIPTREYRSLCENSRFAVENIRSFSSEIGVAAGIVVGRLQHDGKLQHWEHNDLRQRYELRV
jgi:HTH-type transcriptional regulator/antitoxin HigA